MSTQHYDSSASGYIIENFEGIGRTFTEVEIIQRTEHHVLAKAKRYGRWWMLKAIQPEKANEQVYQQMLRKELEILMRMQSPYITQATGIEPVEGLGMCIVMEYVDGKRLDKWLAERPNKENRLRLTDELLKAVEYIHSIGIVHRDLKPSNIMVTRNGDHIKLIDFGLADNDHMAILKQPAGTPRYMAPEQVADSIPDIRNDIYSLGIVLQQLLPEHKYQSAIRKCFLPIEVRYQSISSLRQSLQSKTKLKQKITISTIAMTIVFLSVGLGIQTTKLHQLENKRLRIDEAIEEGIKKADKVFEAIGMEERLDTCMYYEHIFPYYREHYSDVDNITNIYFDSIRPFFTKTEIFEIINAINTHCNERRQIWFDKVQQILNKNETTTLH